MRKLKENELRLAKQDHAEVRQFIKEISLKLRRRRSQDEEEVLSLYDSIAERSSA